MKFLHVQDDKDSVYGREWRWRPNVYWHTGSIYFAWELQLIKWENKPREPWTIGFYQFVINVNPLKWRLKSDHLYYDGPHCFYDFGPISVGRSGLGWCEKARD